MNHDIKDLLGTAIGDEPPLRIDRDEVFRAGRKRLRRRRLLQSGGVAVAVVAAAVGAVTLTGLVDPSGSGPSMPPAASRTTGPTSADQTAPVPPRPPSATTTTTTPDVPSDGRSAQLTGQLYSILAKEYGTTAPEGQSLATFQKADGRYVYRSDVVHRAVHGAFEVTVTPDVGTHRASCDDVPAPFVGCATQFIDGVAVTYGDWQNHSTGEFKVYVVAMVPGKLKVTATASNRADSERGKAETPPGSTVFAKDELARIIVRAEFRVG